MGFFQHPESSMNSKQHRGYDTESSVPSLDFTMNVLQRLNPQTAELPSFDAYEKKFDSMLDNLALWHHPSQHHRPKGTLGQVWGRCNSINQKQDFENKNHFKFDRVVITRYDIAYGKKIDLNQFPENAIVSDGMYGPTVISDAWCCGPSKLIDLWGQQLHDIPKLVNNQTMSLGPHEWLKAHFDLHQIPWITADTGISIQR